MSVVSWADTRRSDAAPPVPPLAAAREPSVRTIRVGLLGLGQVGQAVARLATESARLNQRGLRIRVLGALVRQIDQPRRCPKPPRLTTNPAAFLRGNYDVVIEALGAVEPARTLVARLLGRGIPVVTANKALVAAHGAELSALAAKNGTALRYEASALAGVPFLGALAARPFVSDVSSFCAVVNGTSNFILSKLDAERCSFDSALAAARALGLTEPDPSRDLDGLDAADKLSLLASLFGWGTVAPEAIDVQGIRDITADDLVAARTLGGTIKPLVSAVHGQDGLATFIGPALVPARHPLAALAGTLSGIHLSGRHVSDLCFSGPGAGPDITAATILDDVVEAATSVLRLPRGARAVPPRCSLIAAVTDWFVRARFPGLVPDAAAAAQLFASHGLAVLATTDSIGDARWFRLGPATREHVSAVLARVEATHRLKTAGIRAVG